MLFRDRITDLRKDTRFKYVMVFKNQGPSAGATLSHSHSQLIALPVIPIRVQAELDGAQLHYRLKERCIFCDIIHYEHDANKRLLFETEHFVVLAPFAPRFAFELNIYPKRHQPSFEGASEPEMENLAEVLREVISRINGTLNQPDFNLILHNSPFLNQDIREYYHWHLELSPILARVAGFEWGTGFYINPVPPEESIQALKSIP